MHSPEAATLWVHWGRNGAGPKFLYETVKADCATNSAFISFNPDSEISEQLEALPVSQFSVPTYNSKLGVITGIPRLLANMYRLRKWIQDNHIKRVVSTMESIYQSIAIPLLLPRDVEYVSCIHDGQSHPGEGHILQEFGRHLELGRADFIVTFSDAVTKILQNNVRQRILVEDHPPFDADIPVSEARTLPTVPVVGFFGRLQKYKGLDLLLESARILRESGLEFELEIVGHGEEAVLQETEAGKQASWDARWIPESEISHIISRFDVMVFPYIEASQSGPVTLALSHAIPCVSTPVGAIPSQVAGFGLVSAEVTAESFAEELRKLISDAPLYRELSQSALELKHSKFSWNDLARNIRSHESISSE
ncbi:2-deoxystreptamine glucosyltransferase [Corynebacterium kalinowskii]|uniref:2-deoxystreptamine glucosyltransferase n=1 Tax=Corynebacterium kalinowskii TaxID=2675216 RepID=A0A6B8VUQ6_9CORY|nr:glycosyltransferase [Corynebacterium kalinowskii]QGU01010.1 2-deoxystreptamine glucosyltransferase [Corynebacterium kalinowskii]